MLTSQLTPEEIRQIDFKYIGHDVRLSRKVSFYNPKNISIGDYTRIDDFCVISAGLEGIEIGAYVHIAIMVSLIGKAKIQIGDFAGLSSRVAVYSSNDDYSGEFLTNPTVDSKYTNITNAPVIIGKHAIVGAGTVILPGVTLGEGVSIGALSLVNKDCEPFKVYVGVPAKVIKDRSRRLLELEKQFLDDEKKTQRQLNMCRH